MKKLLLLILSVTLFILPSQADNTGQLNGTVTDSISGEPLVGANIYVMLNGTPFGTTSDLDGYYVLKPLQPGMYDVVISYMGYSKTTISDIKISQGSIKILNVKLTQSLNLPEVKIDADKHDDLISVEPREAMDAEIFRSLPSREIADAITILPGIYQAEEGGKLYFRGSRPEATEYYVDNMRVSGDLGVPAGAVAEIIVYSGGIPARYGDVTGGVVVITTKSYNMNHRE